MDKVIKVLVLAVVCALTYLTVMSILSPVQFDKEQLAREAELQVQLKKIATYEDAFEDVYRRFATKEELVEFLQNGKLYYVTAEGTYTDAMRESGLTEAQAAAQGLIKRDTVWVSAKDSLLKDGTDIATLFKVGNTSHEIKIDTAFLQQEIGTDTVAISVFQATVPFEHYLGDLDKNRLKDKIEMAKKHVLGYPGLRIGSLNEVKLTGNWE